MKCIFCDITNGKEKSYKIYENENIIAFLDINPINEGHILIAPKKHYLDIEELSKELLNEIIDLSQRIVVALKRVYKPNGYSLIQNGGEFNDIGHFHIHIFPCYQNDGFGWVEPNREFNFNKDIASKIIEALI